MIFLVESGPSVQGGMKIQKQFLVEAEDMNAAYATFKSELSMAKGDGDPLIGDDWGWTLQPVCFGFEGGMKVLEI